MDDTDGGAGISVVYNLTFRRCQWYNCGMNFRWQNNASGFVLFDGQLPGSFSSFPTTSEGRAIIQGPGLWVSGQQYAGLRVALTGIAQNLATYQTPDVTGGAASRQYRVTASLAAIVTGTPTITVVWTDPDVGVSNATILSSALATGAVTSATISIVVLGGTPITVQGSQTGTGAQIVARYSDRTAPVSLAALRFAKVGGAGV